MPAVNSAAILNMCPNIIIMAPKMVKKRVKAFGSIMDRSK